MGKWLALAAAVTVVGSVSIVSHFYASMSCATRNPQADGSLQQTCCLAPSTNSPSEIEECDAIEPLVVEGNTQFQEWRSDSPTVDEPTPRVELTLGMLLPPRPDAEAGYVLYMPYADEDEGTTATGNPIWDLVASVFSRLSLFGSREDSSSVEESEPAGFSPLAPESDADPAMDYHRYHQHCPYSGAYYCPYSRR